MGNQGAYALGCPANSTPVVSETKGADRFCKDFPVVYVFSKGGLFPGPAAVEARRRFGVFTRGRRPAVAALTGSPSWRRTRTSAYPPGDRHGIDPLRGDAGLRPGPFWRR